MTDDRTAFAPPPPWAVPAALLAAYVVTGTGLGRFLLQSSIAMELHELGHALVLWLGSRMAVPLPMVTLTFSDERSPLVWLVVAGLLVWLGRRAIATKHRGLAWTCAALFALQTCFSFLLSAHTLEGLVAFAGLAGELALATLLIVAAYHPLPTRAPWEQWRYVSLALGAASFALSGRRWWAARRNDDEIPWGSFWGGDGDLDQLRDVHGWSGGRIVSTYLMLVAICGAAVLAQYLYAHARVPARKPVRRLATSPVRSPRRG